jgi:IS4 transposase
MWTVKSHFEIYYALEILPPRLQLPMGVCKIVGLDVPLVLDAIPRERGQSKDEIVEELLTYANEMVTFDLLMMDREFDSEGVKETCEEYSVHYLNSTRLFDRSDEAATIAWTLFCRVAEPRGKCRFSS